MSKIGQYVVKKEEKTDSLPVTFRTRPVYSPSQEEREAEKHMDRILTNRHRERGPSGKGWTNDEVPF